jgi:integrase
MTKIRLKHVNGFVDRHGTARHYFRRRGQKAIPLPGLPGSTEFMDAYAAALAGTPDQSVEIGASRTTPGTISALIVSYYQSAEWRALSDDTRKVHQRTIERFRLQNGDKPVHRLLRKNIVEMLAGLPNVSAKRHWLGVIRGLLRHAVPTMLASDPTEGIKAPKMPKSKGHHCWTDDEIAQYRAYWPLGTQQRLVMEFAFETMSRRGEVVRLGPQHVKDGWIRIERTHGSDDVSIPMSPELQAACDAMPKGHLTYIVTTHGKPRSKVGVGIDFAKWATEAGLPARCRMHGLKKGGMRRLAENGRSAHEIMAVSGHKTLRMVQHYTAAADKRRLAERAMGRDQSANGNVTNLFDQSYKPTANPLKAKG